MTEQLPLLTPDAARATRTLERCRRKLVSGTRISQPNAQVARLEPAALIGLATAYVVAMAGTVIRILR